MTELENAPTRAPGGAHGWRDPVLVALATTLVVGAIAYAVPRTYAATGVGLAFLAVTYSLVIRGDDTARIQHHGLALGGLTELDPLDARRLTREGARAVAWALLCSAVVLPPFWLGYVAWFTPRSGFAPPPLVPLLEPAVGQLLLIALPEEAFYRGYLQTRLDDAWRPRLPLLGARLGPGLLVTSAIFALGHVLTQPHPARLAVFFPSLLFGWLRNRTGGIGAAVVLHALCNLFSEFLRSAYGLG